MQAKRDGDAVVDLMMPTLIFIIPKKHHTINMSDIINPCRTLTMRQLINLLSGINNSDDMLLGPYIAKDEHYATIEEQSLSLQHAGGD